MLLNLRRWGAAVAVGLLLAGCSAGSSGSSSAPVSSASMHSAPAEIQSPSASTTITKVVTIVEENHSAGAASAGMPYLRSLAETYGQATSYVSLTHPSLPNYLVMAGGSTFGVHDDAPPSSHPLSGRSVFDVAVARGARARTYAEAMPQPCGQSAVGAYAVKHNPWAYFSDAASRRGCLVGDVPAGTTTSGALFDDVRAGTLPRVGLLVPDICHDAHDCSLGTADTWLHGWIPRLMQGPDWTSGRLAIVVTFDEVEGRSSGSLLTVVIAPQLHHRVVTAPVSHLSWSRWMTELVGGTPVRDAAKASSLGRAFGLD